MTEASRWRRLIDQEYLPTSASLSIFRVLFAGVGLAMLPPRYQWVAQLPDSLLNPPPGPTYFFITGVPPAWFFIAIDVGIVLALVYLLAGRRVFAASLILTACLLVGNSWAYSFGKIDHDILLVLTPLFLALAGWDGSGRVRAWPLSLFALTIALAMFTAAVQKAFTGWLDLSTSATLGHLVRNNFVLQKEISSVTLAMMRNTPQFTWELLDYATVLLEGGFIAAYFNRRAFKLTCAIACVFHLGIAATMRLIFAFNLAAYGAFADWDILVRQCGLLVPFAGLQAWFTRRSEPQVLMAGLALSLIVVGWINPFSALLRWLVPGGTAVALVAIAGLAALSFLISQIMRWRWHERSNIEAPRAL